MRRPARTPKQQIRLTPARHRARKALGEVVPRATPELCTVIRALVASRRVARRPTLGAVRTAVQKSGVTWSKEGELLFPQDRTALVIELDELIDAYGTKATATDLIAGNAGRARSAGSFIAARRERGSR